MPRQTSIRSLVPAEATVEDQPYNGKIYMMRISDSSFLCIVLLYLLYCRQWVVSENQFVLTGIVAGNPTGECEKRSLPDVYNFVGNEDVSILILSILRYFCAPRSSPSFSQ